MILQRRPSSNWRYISLYITTIIITGSITALAQPQTQSNVDSVRRLDEVVVTASKSYEQRMKSPVSVFSLSPSALKLTPSVSYFDAIGRMQGIQTATVGLGFTVVNSRGFTNTTNVRFSQLVDGMDMASPHIGAAIGTALMPTDLDIQKVELLPGIASVLYGMNTVNGLVNTLTKNPFDYTGLTVQQKSGVTQINNNSIGSNYYNETNLRWAQKVNNRLAYKVNFSYLRGHDWVADDYSDLNPAANKSLNLFGADNPGYNAVNSYGNESSDTKTISLKDVMGSATTHQYTVSRTGYREIDLTDYKVEYIKTNASVYYRFANNGQLEYSFRSANVNSVYQRANRFDLEGYQLMQNSLRYTSPSIQAKTYYNFENTGNSYNLRSMGENIDAAFKPSTSTGGAPNWFTDFTNTFNSSIASGSAVTNALQTARAAADNGRYQPGTDAFNQTLKRLQGINDWNVGAALKVKQGFLQSEVQVNLAKEYIKGLQRIGMDIALGADNRTYFFYPDGNYFINPEGKSLINPNSQGNPLDNFKYQRTGGYVSIVKRLWNEKLTVNGVVRADKSDYYSLKWNPRASIVYMPAETQSFRASFQSAYRFPSTFEAFSAINSGNVQRLGGLPVMSQNVGVFENAYLDNSVKSFQSAVKTDVNVNHLSTAAAITKNEALLVKNSYDYMKPEQVYSLEAGYRGSYLSNRLFVDVDFYYNSYQNFIAQVNMDVPVLSAAAPDIPTALNSSTTQNKYRMYTNAQSKIYTIGWSGGITYVTKSNWRFTGNTTFNKLVKSQNEDGLEDGFNTPPWMLNMQVGKQELFENISASVGIHWQQNYSWQSFLTTWDSSLTTPIPGGVNVPAYSNVDAQVSYAIVNLKSVVKIGANNLFNTYYYSFGGGPHIGGLYYVSWTASF